MISDFKIVIVNLNLKEDTLELLDSLVRAGASPEQIIIIDNCSTDGSISAFRSQFQDRLQIIQNDRNYHFCAACNQGFQAALDQGAKWILLLNNDTYVANDFFVEIEKVLQTNPPYTLFSPAIFYHTNPDKIWFLGSYLVPGTLIAYNPYLKKRIPQETPNLLSVDFVSGCAMIIHKDVFEKIGFFEPSLLIYWDEVDYCWRARQAGFRMACITRARMWHKISETMSRQKPEALYLRTRNQVRFYRKYSHGLQRPIMYLFAAYKSILVLGRSVLKGEFELIKPVVRGWINGWNAP